MPVRNYVAVRWPGEGADFLLGHGPIIGEFDGRLTIRAIKINLDGALGSRGAALLEPYADDPGNTGLLTHTPEELRPVLERACAAASRSGPTPSGTAPTGSSWISTRRPSPRCRRRSARWRTRAGASSTRST
jgi:hypothetical protein